MSDPDKRRHYDLGEEGETFDDGVDVQSLGRVGRVFGAVISRVVGVPIPTQISHEVLEAAREICRF